jgi:N-acetylglucosaminyldiphosphoundecaprenol N-acetyl-beta-D-mannosaminyltransferase
MTVFETEDIFDYSVFTSQLDVLNTDSKNVINTINQYSYVIAEKDSDFKKALMDSEVLLPDGVGILFAIKLLKGKKIKKIAGADLHGYLLDKLNKEGGGCFYLGSSEPTLQGIKERLTREYPRVRAGFYSPPFKKHFNEAENLKMLEAVNHFKPDVLFVGMTAPKQEKWVNENKLRLNANLICSIGAVFDFYGGRVERPAKIWVDLKLEWFVRLIKEPKRMWKRYLYYGPFFVYLMIKEKITNPRHK